VLSFLYSFAILQDRSKPVHVQTFKLVAISEVNVKTGIPDFYWTILRFRHQTVKSRAKGNSFRVTKSHAWRIFCKQRGLCARTLKPLFLPRERKDYREGKVNAFLTRIKPSKGFVNGNVQWIYKDSFFTDRGDMPLIDTPEGEKSKAMMKELKARKVARRKEPNVEVPRWVQRRLDRRLEELNENVDSLTPEETNAAIQELLSSLLS
jgi:hypothetical protein